ncbi:MAG: hypothetical protein IKT26_08750, partial [Bacteroidaceae bacterium]|nr:hypothetical protein [Bacteroidaceae bacterium]
MWQALPLFAQRGQKKGFAAPECGAKPLEKSMSDVRLPFVPEGELAYRLRMNLPFLPNGECLWGLRGSGATPLQVSISQNGITCYTIMICK